MCDAPHPYMSSEAPDVAEGAGKGAGSTRLASSLVAAGILLSRISGLLREAVFSKYFGTTAYADVFRAGLRMPNLLQNLLGEGTLSASFIPVYSRLLEEGKEEEAGKVASAIFGLLFALAGALALVGVLFAPFLVSVFLYGFEGERRELAIKVVRILFPMTGVLVLSAWALGILNSHRRFFLAYVAPVFWSVTIIAAMILLGRGMEGSQLLIGVAWGALLGGVLQFLVQLPSVLRLQRMGRPSLGLGLEPVREIVRNAGPAILGRGVVQLSGYVDMFLATLLSAGAIGAMGYAQTLYVLPVSLFGMSVAAAELPELSRTSGVATDALRLRANAGLERIAFFVVPSFIAFVALGDVAISALFERGRFSGSDTLLVHYILIAFSIGLLASTGTRLFSSTFFALRDTRTPARFAAVRVVLAAVLSLVLMMQFEPVPKLGLPGGIFSNLVLSDGQRLGAIGLAFGSGLAAWVEWGLLRRALRKRLGPVGAGPAKVFRMFLAGGIAAAAAWGIRLLAGDLTPILLAAVVFSVFGIVYLVAAAALGLSEADLIRARLQRVMGRG